MISKVNVIGILTDDRLIVEQKDNLTIITGFILTVVPNTEFVKYVEFTMYNDLAKEVFNEQQKYRDNLTFFSGDLYYNDIMKKNVFKLTKKPVVLEETK